ncbi:MAG: hypothetical protein M0026_04630 [Nocardiopsaceae bacterium]|nr:hypothetical protein [Nocardiopsaceae bacterium]
MPSHQHEVLIELFRNNLALAPELLHEALGIEVPDHNRVFLESCDLTDVNPTEYRADVTVALRRQKEVEMAIIVEVQRSPAKKKRLTWPVYVATLRARLGCPVILMVVSPKQKVADWCAVPIELGHPGFVLEPLVIGPAQVPVVTDPVKARGQPELSVLSALAHGDSPEVLDAFGHALESVDSDKFPFYYDYVSGQLSDAAREYWEKLMAAGTYEWQTDIARKYVSEGKAEGKAEGEANAVLLFLAARGIPVPDEARERITACTDLGQLEVWIRRAATVDTADELFD